MKSAVPLSLAFALSGAWNVTFAGEPSPPPGPNLPGESKAKIETYWLAPYVQASEGFGGRKITWFTKDGRIRRQADVSVVEPGFLSTIGDREVVEGVNEPWQIALPPEPKADQSGYSMSSYITSTPDSRVFVREFHPKPGWIALDIYVHGQLASTIGPFSQYKGNGPELNDNGSTGLIVWKDETKTTAQVVTTSSTGALRLRVDCNNQVYSPIAAPDGAGVLVRPNGESGGQNTFMWYTREGKVHSLDISPNPYCLGWIPGTHQALFWTSFGNETRHYRLVDWDTGKELWDIQGPGDRDVLAVGFTSRLIIFAAPELYQPGPWMGSELFVPDSKLRWIRTFYAISVQDGSIAARWQPDPPRTFRYDGRDKFLSLGDKLFYITADEFTEINMGDIFSKKNGWK